MADRREVCIGIVGCGFVADYYVTTLANYPWIRVIGVFDIDMLRLNAFAAFHHLHKYDSLDALVEDRRVDIVLNLTNPRAHYEVSRHCLEAGHHVYSEKPLAMTYEEAEQLVTLAETRGLMISSAPCSLFGNAAQTLWHGVRNKLVGDVRLVYAELDDGMIHLMPYRKWRSRSGAPWPYQDEFEVGCTLEHAGYYLSWLIAMFGPVTSLTAYAECLIEGKTPDGQLCPADTPDFSVGILKFENGVVARLTTTIVGPHDHSIRLIGEGGVMEIDDCWFNDANVYYRKLLTIRRKTFLAPIRRKYRLAATPKRKLIDTGGNRMDFAAGVAELAEAIQQERSCRLSSRFSLHVTEVSLALQGSGNAPGPYTTRSRFDAIQPMTWTQSD
ncbi:MAG: Gfo/Idh/MocA family protein [Bacteroidota bacterium]